MWLTRMYYTAQIARIEARERQAVDDANAQAQVAAQGFEQWKAAQKPKVITITREVDRVIEIERAWSSSPLPDSVRNAIEAAERDLAEPVDPVPRAWSFTASDKQRPSEGLRRRD